VRVTESVCERETANEKKRASETNTDRDRGEQGEGAEKDRQVYIYYIE